MARKLMSLRVQIVLIMILAWLAPVLALGVTITTVFFPALRSRAESALVARSESSAHEALDSVKRLITLAKDVTYDGELAAAYSNYQSGAYRYQDFFMVSRNYLERRFARNPVVRYAAFFPIEAPEQFLFTSSGYPSALFFQNNFQMGVMELGESLDTLCRFIYRGDELYLVRNLLNQRLERFGMLVMSIEKEALFRPLADAAAQSDARLAIELTEYGADALDWDALAPGLMDAGEAVTWTMRVVDRDFTLGVHMSEDKAMLYAGMERFRWVLMILLGSLVPVCVLVVLYVHRRVVKPITILNEAARKIERGELGGAIPMRGGDELGQLGATFSAMSAELKRLIDTVYKEQIALRDAQIQAMQSRINPHFLNNALELINWQALMDGDDAISSMVGALSVLMNAALDRSDERLVPIKEELGIADAYCFFLDRRFGDRLTIDRDIDVSLLDCLIPRLVIQPLLENAVDHGVAPAGGGRVALKVFAAEGRLTVQVINDGRVPSREALNAVNATLREPDAPGDRVALRNVSERLRLIYLGQAEVKLMLNVAGEVVAQLSIPLGGPEPPRPSEPRLGEPVAGAPMA